MSTLMRLIEHLSRNKMQTAILAALLTLIGLVSAIQNQMHQQELAAERVRVLDREARRQSLNTQKEYVDTFNSMVGYGKTPEDRKKLMFNGMVDWNQKQGEQRQK